MATPTGPVVLVAVGDELLTGHTQDTNSTFLARRLFAAGQPVRRIEVVGDDDAAIGAALRRALEEAGVEVVIVSGGIGPTPDDRTFGAVAAALDLPLELNAAAITHVEEVVQRLFAAGRLRSAQVSEGNRRAALLPAGAEVIQNRSGMSPAIALRREGRLVLVLPGIPRELTAIFDEEVLPRFFAGAIPESVRELRYMSVPEAEMYEPMRMLEREFPDVLVGSYPQTERRELIIRFRGTDAAVVDAAVRRFGELRPEA